VTVGKPPACNLRKAKHVETNVHELVEAIAFRTDVINSTVMLSEAKHLWFSFCCDDPKLI